MGQIHGSGTGNWNNAAVVDGSLGPQQGRLHVSSLGSVAITNTVVGIPVSGTPSDYGVEIARGNITGYDYIHKFGKNPDVANAVTFEAVWNGGNDYTGFNATTPEVLEIFSADAADTDTGVGARTLTMPRLLDGNYVKMGDVSITLSGTTSVYTTGSYMRCSRAIINTAGASGMNIGEITIRQSGTTANIMAVMPAEYNQTMIACDTIQSGTTAYMTHMFASLAGRSTAICDIRLLARPSGGVFNVKEEFSIATAGTGYVGRHYGDVPKGGFSAGTDIKVMASSNANSTGVAGGFDLILIDNDI